MMTSLACGEEDGLREKRQDNNRLLLDRQDTVIQRFYAGSSVLVTGATGFMGKVLIEKLLRSCPDIHTVYMMVREKKGRSLDERIDDFVGSPCFDRIKKERPDFRSKLRVVAGDISSEALGISMENRHLLELQVDIVFHVAATVRFDEQLSSAILQNVRGTREVLNLCKTFRKLRSVVHVSTAYSNCPESQIDERFYAPLIPSDHAIYLAETADHSTLDHLSHKLMGKWPNSYSFTKALSEDAVRTHGQDLPVGVFRPSIVVCTKSEPMPGWIDNVYGPTGVLVASSAGLLRTMQADQEKEANIVPCDMVINALIASAWDVADNRTSSDVPFYNFASTRENPLTWGDFSTLYYKYGCDYPTSRAIWFWTINIMANRFAFLVCKMFLHFLPAALMDLFFLVTNKKPQMMRIYQKIHRFLDVIAYFATNDWRFDDKNVVDLWKKLSQSDQDMFYFDMRSLKWDTYIKDSCPGIRSYLLKDPLDTLPEAKIRMLRLYYLHRFTQCVLVCLCTWISLVSLSYVVA